MFKHFPVLAFVAAVLAGCVLESRNPIYTDAEARLVLGQSAVAVTLSSWKDGKWVPDEEHIALAVEGQHYVATAKDATMTLHFVPLSGTWHVLQANEAGKPSVYMLADVTDASAEMRSISCTDLKADTTFALWIEHDGDDCFVKTDAPVRELFTALLEKPGELSSRLDVLR